MTVSSRPLVVPLEPPAGSSGSVIGNLAPKAGRRRRRRVSRRRRPPGRLDRTSSVTWRETEQGRERTQLLKQLIKATFLNSKLESRPRV